MAKVTAGELSERLFQTFVRPLVLGGALSPGKPVGGRLALVLREGATPADTEALSLTQLARVQLARKLAPIDFLEPTPTGDEWVLVAMLHDLVQATHPGFDSVLRRTGPARIVTIVERTLEHVAPPRTLGEALSRHTWFSRMFDITRTDVDLHWWTGHQVFLGEEPPPRLLAWPEVRRVEQLRTERPLMDLPLGKTMLDAERFARAVAGLMRKVPLTDVATATRRAPAFVWTDASLGLVQTDAGRTLALRALEQLPTRAVDHALGRATRILMRPEHRDALRCALALLRERALARATGRLTTESKTEPVTAPTDDERFAIKAGAVTATRWLREAGSTFPEAQRVAITARLERVQAVDTARELHALLAG